MGFSLPGAVLGLAVCALAASVPAEPRVLGASDLSDADVSTLADKIAGKVSAMKAAEAQMHARARAMHALSEPQDAVTTSCISRSVYLSLVDTTAAAAADLSSNASTQDKVSSTIFLVCFIVCGLFLLFFGEHFVKSAITIIVSFCSFMAFLYLWDWIFTPQTLTASDLDFVKCGLPLLLAMVCAIVATMVVMALISSIEWLTFFVFGAACGFVGMMALRSAILAGNPHLAASQAFDWYWVGLVTVSVVCGVVAVVLRKVVILIATVSLGGYMVAAAVLGLMQLYQNKTLSGAIFFYIWLPTMAVGALVQIFVVRPHDRDAK